MGIKPIAAEVVKQELQETKVKITQDQWMLNTIQGYKVPFMQQP